MTPCHLPRVGRRRGVFASDVRGCTVWDGGTRRVPLAGECPLCGAPTTIDTGALRTEPPLRVTASAATWSRYAGSFVSEDAQVGGEAQLCGHATRGSAPSAALGRLEDGAPASRDRLRCWGCAPSAALGRLEDGAPASRDRLRCWGCALSAAPQQRLIQAP